jgi:hypothetical protein
MLEDHMSKKILFIASAILFWGASLSLSLSQQKTPVLSNITIEPPEAVKI